MNLKERRARNVLRAAEVVETCKREGFDVELVSLSVNGIQFKVESPRRLGDVIEELFLKWPDIEQVAQYQTMGLGRVLAINFEREKESSIP